jgi:hypothetical protein
LNIFKYDEEEFMFEEGRLLLRGNNGAGKSRVLALQLPFLLDGEMASHRVEPDGDPAKRIEWNLLMNRHENRLGYTWIEFGRRDKDGVEHYVTLGCGMHARKGTGIPPNARWFFVTSQRVGETLRLMSGNRVPLNRERLEAVIGQNSVYRTAGAYRFLGARYGSLIDLLIQLRKPQIMRDFKADDLSQLLSEALPALSLRLIENVSISFRSLESDRQQLADLMEVRKSVDTFLASYSHYVRVAVRRRAADVRRAHSQFETAQREIKRLSEESDKTEIKLIAAETEERGVEETLAAAHQTERTLLASPEMKNAEDLRHAKETRDERANRVDEAEATRLRDHAVRHQRGKERQEAEAFVAEKDEVVSRGHVALTEVWQEARLPNIGFPSRDAADMGARRVFDQTMANRVKAIAALREKNLQLEKCVADEKRKRRGLTSGEMICGGARKRNRRCEGSGVGPKRSWWRTSVDGKPLWKSCRWKREKIGTADSTSGLRRRIPPRL